MHAKLTATVVGGPSEPPDRSEQLRARLASEPGVEALRLDDEYGGWLALGDLLAVATGPVAVVDASYVGHTSPLLDTVADSRLGSAQLHDDGVPLGILRIGPADLVVAEEVVRDLAAEAGPLDVVALGSRLAAAGVAVQPVDVAPYVAGVTTDPAEARRLQDLAERTDEHRLRLVTSARPGDGFYSTFVVRKIARPVTGAAVRLGLRPDAITIVSLFVGLAAAASFAGGQRWAMVLGAVLLQISLVLDCVDGEVARYTLRFSPFGAWLDGVADRVKEFAVYAGLAVGAAAAGADVWLLAGAALGTLVLRHHIDFGFAIRQSAGGGDDTTTHEGSRSLGKVGSAASRLSDRTNRRAAQMWAKRVVIMPIGERWLIISVVAAIWDARAVFVTLLVTGAVAMLYTTVGRVLRSAAEAAPTDEKGRHDLAVLADAPGVVRDVPWLGWRYGWLTPAASRLVEFAAVLAGAAVLGESVLVTAYVVLAVVALRLYDLVYRLRHLRTPPARWAAPTALGALIRPTVLVLAAFVGVQTWMATSTVLAVLVLAVSTAEGRSAWRNGARPAIVPGTAERSMR